MILISLNRNPSIVFLHRDINGGLPQMRPFRNRGCAAHAKDNESLWRSFLVLVVRHSTHSTAHKLFRSMLIVVSKSFLSHGGTGIDFENKQTRDWITAIVKKKKKNFSILMCFLCKRSKSKMTLRLVF